MGVKWLCIMGAAIAFSVSFGTALYNMSESKIEVEAAKSGLQQCLEYNRILWKKECSK